MSLRCSAAVKDGDESIIYWLSYSISSTQAGNSAGKVNKSPNTNSDPCLETRYYIYFATHPNQPFQKKLLTRLSSTDKSNLLPGWQKPKVTYSRLEGKRENHCLNACKLKDDRHQLHVSLRSAPSMIEGGRNLSRLGFTYMPCKIRHSPRACRRLISEIEYGIEWQASSKLCSSPNQIDCSKNLRHGI